MKKGLIFVFMLLTCLLVMPSVHAEAKNAEEDYKEVEVEDITNTDTLKTEKNGVLTGTGTADITLTYKQADFEILPTGEVSGRPNDKAFIGVRVTLPEGAQSIKVKTIESSNEDTIDDSTTFDKYFPFDATDFEEAAKKGDTSVSRSYEVTWQSNGGTSEDRKITIHLVVELENVSLHENGKYGQEEDTPLWDEGIWYENVKKVNVKFVGMLNGKVIDGATYGEELPIHSQLTAEEAQLLTESFEKLNDKDLVFDGFYADSKLKNKYDFTKPFEQDVTIYMNFKTKTQASEANPKTGDNLMTYVVMSTVSAMGILGTGLYLKKVNA